jgi:ribosomal protein RSM22 (predicted rRNA methylase)
MRMTPEIQHGSFRAELNLSWMVRSAGCANSARHVRSRKAPRGGWHSVCVDLPADLREAIEGALGATPVAELGPAVEGLIARYRSPAEPGPEAILARPVDVLAYAAYRMPATYAAVLAALTQLAVAVPEPWHPRRLLDLGGGTGAAVWAATDVFGGLPEMTVLDRVPEALGLGRRLAAARPALRSVQWTQWRHGTDAAAIPPADLVTISYLLGELPEPERDRLVAAAGSGAGAVVVVEPGTPAGHLRVLAARDALLAAGLHIVAPCPHAGQCPIRSPDWCHFAVRVNRSALHRRAKGATLGHEDEKFSYVAAVRDPGPASGPAAARVLRHPVYGKGLVRLRLCAPGGDAEEVIVSKRQGERYRAARDLAWGDTW